MAAKVNLFFDKSKIRTSFLTLFIEFTAIFVIRYYGIGIYEITQMLLRQIVTFPS